MLNTLDPLSATVHLCIIGSGARYWEYEYASITDISPLDQEELVRQKLEEEAAKLNSMACLLQKKRFRHVR